MKCPVCDKEISIIYFGDSFVGACCNRVIYNFKLSYDEGFQLSLF